MPKTKSFIVAVEGDTVDGRKIERQWLTDIAATYNRATYGARVNKEHIKGATGTEPFKAYGDVLACSTEEVELELGGKKVKKLALRAEIEATDELVQLVADKQKIYTSIEVTPNFANTGKAGLVGLAVTDTPASLGTEVLSFAAKNPLPQLPALSAAGNVFSIGHETTFQLADGDLPAPVLVGTEAKGFFAQAAKFFQNLNAAAPAAPSPAPTPAPAPAPSPAEPANDNDPRFAAILSGMEKMTQGIEAMGAKFAGDIAALGTKITAVEQTIDTTAAGGQFSRKPATGGNGAIVTDC